MNECKCVYSFVHVKQYPTAHIAPPDGYLAGQYGKCRFYYFNDNWVMTDFTWSISLRDAISAGT